MQPDPRHSLCTLAVRRCGVTLCLPCKADGQACEQSHELIALRSRLWRFPRVQPALSPALSGIEAVAVYSRASEAQGLGRFTTEEEVDYVIDKMVLVVTKLRELSPLYEMAKEGIDISKMKWQTA